jgi:hypothetical protein
LKVQLLFESSQTLPNEQAQHRYISLILQQFPALFADALIASRIDGDGLASGTLAITVLR